MNKKQKTIIRRKVFQLSATFFVLSLIFSACKKEETDLGSGLSNDGLNLVTSDTFSIVTYSEEFVDMESDETSISLLGAYIDPVFGGVDCGIITQVVPEALTQSFPDAADLTMDSVVLSLAYSSINYYANLNEITVEVYEIDDALVRNDQAYLTTTEPTLIGPNLVLAGSETIFPDFVKKPVVGDDTLSPQLRISLDPSVGLDLVADSKAGLMGEDFQNSTFKGLYIKVNMPSLTEGEGTILYFSLENALSKMTLYYRNAAGEKSTFDFDINSRCARYNKITYDRAGTDVEAALEDKSKGEEAFYYQGGAIRAIVEFPYIDQFYTDKDGNYAPKIINKAVLVLPIQDFQPDPFDPATKLFIAREVDVKTSTFTNDYSSGSVSNSTIAYNEEAKEFRFTVTKEIQAILNGEIKDKSYRIYSPAFFASTIERIIFNGSKTTLKEKPRLEITYTEY